MSALVELLRKRRSIRRFSAEPLGEAEVALLAEALLRAPSSRGRQPWELVLVDDRGALERLSRCRPHGASFVKDAALVAVVLADPTRCDVWVEDCSIACLLVHLAACSLGLGSCWVQVRERAHDESRSAADYVREVVGAPSHLEVEAMVAVGRPAETPPGHPRESLPWAKVSRNRYGEGRMGG